MAHFLGDWRKREKLSEIKPPLTDIKTDLLSALVCTLLLYRQFELECVDRTYIHTYLTYDRSSIENMSGILFHRPSFLSGFSALSLFSPMTQKFFCLRMYIYYFPLWKMSNLVSNWDVIKQCVRHKSCVLVYVKGLRFRFGIIIELIIIYICLNITGIPNTCVSKHIVPRKAC